MTSTTYELLEFATPELSIVIPAYNEAARIGRTLDSIASFLAERALNCEVIVVDDGSTDDTGAVVDARYGDFVSLRLLRCERNGGKGRAVRLGMLVARGRVRLFMDADNSTDIREFERLNDTAARNATLPDVVIASIATPGSQVDNTQSRTRSMLGRMGNALVQRAVLPGIHDSQRGFKLFTAEAADAIFSALSHQRLGLRHRSAGDRPHARLSHPRGAGALASRRRQQSRAHRLSHHAHRRGARTPVGAQDATARQRFTARCRLEPRVAGWLSGLLRPPAPLRARGFAVRVDRSGRRT